MKKLLLMAAAALSVSAASAQAFPELEIFTKNFVQGDKSIDPFTQWKSEGTLNETFSQWFEDGGWKVLSFTNGETYVMNASSFTSTSLQANAGLVTPKITLPANGGILTFTVGNWNPDLSNRNNNMDVIVSTSGNTKEDFAMFEPLKTYRVKAYNNQVGMTLTTYNLSLADYAGKDVYIAFVNKGMYSGALCLNDFRVDKYMADITVTSDALQVEPGEYPITATAKLRTPVSSAGFTAELIIDGKVYSTYTSTRQLNAAYNSYTIAFPDKVSLAMNQTVNYTIKLTPNYEGAESVSIDGSVTCAAGFPAVAVEEEATGVRCGWCPFGAAWMSYLADTYPDKFIGIAIHGGGFALGAMTAPGYSNEFIGNMGVDGYPWGIINRTKVVAPNYLNDVLPQLEKIWAKNVAYGVKINKTYYYSEDNKITVDFSPLTSIDVDNANLKACAILLCDGLTGTDAKWSQFNNYANYSGNTLTQFGVTSENNEALSPYYSYYTENSNPIQNCVFDHVPMGAWPDWRGNDCPLNAEMSVANPANYSITFDIPMQTQDNGFGVQDMTKTSVVVMLLDGKTGAVVTAAKMPYKDYWQGTAVKATDAASKMNAYRLGNQIKVTGDEGTLVEMYSIDGTLLGKKVISGEDFIAPISYRGVVLLRLTNGNDIVLKKVVL